MPTKPFYSRLLSWFKHQTRLVKLGIVVSVFSIVGVSYPIIKDVTGWKIHDSLPTNTLIANHGVVISDSTNTHVEYSGGDKFVNSPSLNVGANYGSIFNGPVIINIPTNSGFLAKGTEVLDETNLTPAWLTQTSLATNSQGRSDSETSQLIFKQLQTFLGPDGFTVKSPYTFLEKGNEIGRVDIGIYGKVGAFCESLWAIEFKKTHSDNDVTWIHELRGKREQFNIQRMMAASTTGFTPAAIRAANQLGIELVRIDDRESVTVTNWIQSVEFTFHNRYWETNGLVNIKTDPAYRRNEIVKAGKLLRDKGSTNLVSVVEYIGHDVDLLLNSLRTNEVRDVVLAYVTPAGGGQAEGSFSTTRPLTTNDVVTIIPFKRPVDVALDWRTSRLVSMSLPIRLRNEVVSGKVILSIYRNLKDGSVLGMGGIVSHMIPTKNRFGLMRARTLILFKEGGMQIHLFDKNNKPMPFAVGSKIEVRGIK
ncbi:MAG: hypothetical protein WA117_11140 [Verrucomicrobiia bacterium]